MGRTADMDSPHDGSRYARMRSPGRSSGWRWWRGGSVAPGTSCLAHMASHPPRSPDPSHHPALHDLLCRTNGQRKSCVLQLSQSFCFLVLPKEPYHWIIINFIRFLCKRNAAQPAVHISVLMVDSETRELPLQFAKSWLCSKIGAKEQPTQNISVKQKQIQQWKYESSITNLWLKQQWKVSISLFIALNPSLATGVWTAVPFLGTLGVQLFIAKSVSWVWGERNMVFTHQSNSSTGRFNWKNK